MLAKPAERTRTMRLRDGRALAWSEWGAPDGLPVLFCTGAAMSGSLGFGWDAVRSLGLRLVAIDRPGLGSSDPHPAKTLLTWVDDIRELAGAQSWREAGAVGFSQGAPFALALAAQGVVRAAALVSGQDELAHPSVSPLLNAEVAAMVRSARDAAEVFERWFCGVASADGLRELIISMSAERDRALYLSDGFREAFEQCMREGFAQGPQGYARDLANTLAPWPFEVECIAAPVDLWYGGLDSSTVHSPDYGATLASRLPRASRMVLPNEGGSILWTRAGEILTRLKAEVRAASDEL